MQFQTFLDPFGTALQQAGMQLNNEAKSIQNATSLYKLGMVKEQYNAMLDDISESRQGFIEAGGAPGVNPGAKGNSTDSKGPLGGSNTEPNSTALFQEVKQFDGLAKRWRYINPALAERYQSRAETTLKSALDLKGKEFQQQSKFMDDLGNAAALAATSPTAQGQALAILSRKLPQGMNLDDILYKPVEKGGLGMVQGPNGQPIWNKGQWESIGQFSKVGQEMRRAQHEEFMERARLKSQELAEKAAERAARASERADIRLRDGEQWHDEATKAREELRADKNAKQVVDKAQSSLERDPLYKNYDRYEQARGAVRFLETKMSQPGGYQNVTAADVQQLRAHYNNILEDFRTRAGGKYSIQEFSKLNGVLQSLDKWASTIGRGTPAAAERPARDAMAAINDEYTTRTENLVKSELKLARNVDKRGGDPENLRLKGDISFLLSQGHAVIKPDTDDPLKKWIFFKDDKDNPLPYYDGAF